MSIYGTPDISVNVLNISTVTLITASSIINNNQNKMSYFSLPDASFTNILPSQYDNNSDTILSSIRADISFNNIPISNLSNGTIMANIYLTDNTEIYIFHQQLDDNYITSFSIGHYADTNGNFQEGDPGRIYFCFQNIEGKISSNSLIPVNSWHSIAVTFNTSSWQLYIDGILDNSGTLSYNPVIPIYNTVTYSGLGFTNHNARISDFLIYNNTILSPLQIAQNNIFLNNVGTISNYIVQDYSNNNIYYLNYDNAGINISFQVAANQYLIIPKSYNMNLYPNTIIDNYGTIINHGTIYISSAAAINNHTSGVFLNEFNGTIINDSSSNANINSGYFLIRGKYSNELSFISTYTNANGGTTKIKNGGIFNNNGIVINSVGGTFDSYYNFLNVSTTGQLINYGAYMNDVQYSPGATIQTPFTIIGAGMNHSLGLKTSYDGLKTIYAWGDNTYGQLGYITTPNTNSGIPSQISNGPSVILQPQVLYNTISYSFGYSSDNTLNTTTLPNSLSTIYVSDISLNTLSLTFNASGYWDLIGSTLTIYGIQNDISYSPIFGGGTVFAPPLIAAPNTISSIAVNSSNNLIIQLSTSSGQNYVNNGNTVNSSVTLSSTTPYPPSNDFLVNKTVSNISTNLPNYILTLDSNFTVPVPASQNYTLPSYSYTNYLSTFSYQTNNILSYTINLTNSTYTFKTNELYNYTITNAVGTVPVSTIQISPYNLSTPTITYVNQGTNTLSLLIQVGNTLSDTFPYLTDVSLNTIHISSVSMREISPNYYLNFIVSASPSEILGIVSDISNNPYRSYTLTTNPGFSLYPSLDVLTNTISSASNITVTTTQPPQYSYNSIIQTIPLEAVSGSTFIISTPINLNPPISPLTFDGSFNTDFSFNIAYNSIPANDVSGTQWLSIVAGGNTSFGLRDQGYLYSWGDNTDGHLGINDLVDTSRNFPSPVVINNCISVTSGLNHALALDSSNQVWSWGDNTYGQMGVDTVPNSISPVNISQLLITAIACGDNHSLAIKSNGDLYTWGNNVDGQLGLGPYITDTSRNYLSLVTNPNNTNQEAVWIKTAGGTNHSLGLQSDGTLYAWGDNTYGQLGNGLAPSGSYTPYKIVLTGNNNIKWVDIAAGANVSMAISNTNQLYAWGSNISGQIGLPAPVDSSYNTPNLISSSPPSNFLKCAIGGSHSLGVGSDNNLYAWGTNTTKQLGNNSAANPQYTPIDVSGNINPIIF